MTYVPVVHGTDNAPASHAVSVQQATPLPAVAQPPVLCFLDMVQPDPVVTAVCRRSHCRDVLHLASARAGEWNRLQNLHLPQAGRFAPIHLPIGITADCGPTRLLAYDLLLLPAAVSTVQSGQPSGRCRCSRRGAVSARTHS